MAHKKPCILIAAAGTAGHIRPAWVLGLQAEERGYEVAWIGSHRDTWVPDTSWERLNVDMQGVRNQGWRRWLQMPGALLQAIRAIYSMFRRTRPCCVFLMGGYITVPVAIVAYFLDVPYIVFEQNTILGFSHRLALPFAHAAFSGLPLVTYRSGIRYIGNPLPPWCVKDVPKEKTVQNILVFGGSMGAMRLYTHIPYCLSLLKVPCVVVHITGDKDLVGTQKLYQQYGIESTCHRYVDSLEGLYAWADIVISRAGAMSISELLMMQKPSILIPYPDAADNHQYHNASWLTTLGGAFLVEESPELDQNILKKLTKFQEKEVRESMSQVMHQLKYNFNATVFWQTVSKIIQSS